MGKALEDYIPYPDKTSNLTANAEDITKMMGEGDRADYPICSLYPYRTGHLPKVGHGQGQNR